MNQDRIHAHNLEDFKSKIRDWANAHLLGNEVVLLEGDLAAGKTEFVKTIVTEFGGTGVSSPTFAIHHSYSGVFKTKVLQIEHFDLYRLSADIADLETSGLFEILGNSSNIVFVEWPSKVPSSWWPANRPQVLVVIQKLSETERYLKITRP